MHASVLLTISGPSKGSGDQAEWTIDPTALTVISVCAINIVVCNDFEVGAVFSYICRSIFFCVKKFKNLKLKRY